MTESSRPVLVLQYLVGLTTTALNDLCCADVQPLTATPFSPEA